MTSTTESPKETVGTPLLLITRMFDAALHLVFEAWTKKGHLDHWSVPHGFTIPFSTSNARPGGAWRSCMRTPDGAEYWLGGTYREVVKDELLVFSHAWDNEEGRPGHETLVTVRFAWEGNRTNLLLKQENFRTVRARNSHAGGWNECLDCLAEYLANV